MADSVLETFRANAKQRTFKDKDRIFAAGEPALSVFLLVEGKVNLATRRNDGSDLIFECIDDGVFGEVSVLAETSRTASAYARGVATVLEMDYGRFKDLLRTSPVLSESVLTAMARRLKRSGSQLQEAVQSSGLEGIQSRHGALESFVHTLARWAGTIWFVLAIVAISAVWVFTGREEYRDGFAGLALVLSLLAIAVSSLVLHSQSLEKRRQDALDRHQFEIVLLARAQNDEIMRRLGEIGARTSD